MLKPITDAELQHLLMRVSDHLCMWERDTGIQSVLVLRMQDGGLYRSCNGKPLPAEQDDVPDATLYDVHDIPLEGTIEDTLEETATALIEETVNRQEFARSAEEMRIERDALIEERNELLQDMLNETSARHGTEQRFDSMARTGYAQVIRRAAELGMCEILEDDGHRCVLAKPVPAGEDEKPIEDQ